MRAIYFHWQEVIERYEAKIKMIDTGTKVKVDQIHVETVIPGLGKEICNVYLLPFKPFERIRCDS